MVKTKMVDGVIFRAPMKNGEELRATIDTYKKKQYVHIRYFYNAGTEFLPSPKGISVTLDEAKQLFEAVDALRSHVAVQSK